MATITGTTGNDTLNGTTSDDQIFGLDGNDTLNGNNGNDVLEGGNGADALNGGAGTDTATYANSTAGVTVNLTTGTGIGGEAQGDTLTSIEKVIGSAFDDNLTAAVSGYVLQGGAGNDVYVIGNQGVSIVEVAGEGTDEVQTSLATLSIAGYANVEKLTYTGTAAFTGTGNALDNIITGGIGNDTLMGGAGADQFFGGAGTDTVSYADATSAVTINLKTGVYTGIAAGDTFNSIEKISGSVFNDVFIPDANANFFIGGGGTGVDMIDLSTSSAAVTVNLTTGTASGGDAQGDTYSQMGKLIGSAFGDTLSSSTAGHVLQGGAGDDLYVIGVQGVSVVEAAGEGTDEVQTGVATFSIAGYANVENLTYTGTAAFTGTGNALDNIITGGIGNDTLSGGAGADQFFGGAGTDTVSYGEATSAVTINLKTGVYTGIAAGDTFNSIEKISGSVFNDVFIPDANANFFIGGGGTGIDTVDLSTSSAAVTVNLTAGTGSGGDAQGDTYSQIGKVIGSTFGDTLSSSTAGHALQGGAGDDIYVVGNQNVSVAEAAGEGTDEVQTSLATLSIAGYANVEKLTYTGTAAFTGTGNASDNIITGGAGNDTLSGGAGADIIIGGNGNDTLSGGDGADQFFGGEGTDTVSYGEATSAVTINLKTGVYTGIAAGDTFDSIERISGSFFNDIFVPDANANFFLGGSGGVDTVDLSTSSAAVTVNLTTGTGSGGDAQGDTYSQIGKLIGSAFGDMLTSSTAGHVLQGGAGDDIYVIGVQGVSVVEAAGEGTDEVQTSLATFSIAGYANVEKLTYTGTAAFTGVGNALDNIITGGIGNDYLSGGAGADQFFGGAGTDIVNYDEATSAVTINLKTGVYTGNAAGDTFDSIEQIRGSFFNDIFVPDANANWFSGGTSGVDTVDLSTSSAAVAVNLTTGTGSGGDAEGDTYTLIEKVIGTVFDDTLASSTSGHVLQGGAGNDIYVIGHQGVSVVEAVGEGTDEVQTSLATLSIAGYANVEHLTYTGTGAFTGFGNASDNIITGGSGNDTLSGGAGADEFFGGAGTDTVSYVDSNTAMIFDFAGGTFSGIGAGDVFYDIEKLAGSNFGDVFIEDANAHDLNGGNGVDMVSYASSTSGITFDLSTPTQTGIAAGDVLTSIEVIQATGFDDILTGNTSNNIFIGGAGADVIDGGAGTDAAWYLTSSAAVQIDLGATTATGGDATGDTLSNIENIIGSAYDDTLTGNSTANKLEGGDGNDTIDGGDGNDTIYGGVGSDIGSVAVLGSGPQADTLHGGNGVDVIWSASNDSGTVAYGDAGNDTITVAKGTAYGGTENDTITVTQDGIAYGGDGSDTLNGNGNGYLLYGEGGSDTFNLNTGGGADGGEGGDIYNINSTTNVVLVQDTGIIGNDSVRLNNVQSLSDVYGIQIGNDLVITSAADASDGIINSGVQLVDWYNGSNTIETFFTADGSSFMI